jgi:prepilin-type N-terminal cleavage/methylation domain-containing protein
MTRNTANAARNFPRQGSRPNPNGPADHRTGHRGYSMIEMMVAVGIASIVAMAAAPNANTFFRKHALAASVEDLAFQIARARMQAVGRNEFVRVRFYDSRTYGIETSSDGSSYTLQGERYTLPKGISVSATTDPRFNRRGLTSAASTIQLSDGQQSKTIRVNMIGNASVS